MGELLVAGTIILVFFTTGFAIGFYLARRFF